MELLIRLAFTLVMEIIMYGIGRAAIAILTLGRYRAERPKEMFRGGHWLAGSGAPGVVPAGLAQMVGVAVFTLFWIVFYALRN